MQIAKNKVAVIEYTLKNNDGEVLDTSEGGEPMAYIQGVGNLIPGLEDALEGKVVGDDVQVTIPPEKAYGLQNDDLVQVVERGVFQGVDDLQVGMQFQAQSDDGVQVIWIADINGDEVTIDGNHPLAGETLNFDVKVIEVRDASAEELDHGHVHGPGGHHH
ncbi:MAG: FKBP-type peptidyl-prolyl cis-trans isomerase [Candidatus Latescibacterota bacterium]|jgi:FKBP-type peptidyl-prolyl cis-trans isomerase SlyD